ncbi:PREDICTED: heterochromatin protein 1-like [Rhagoletis zephyria]|uniref:heterochromatin protein 1-like n=1 Tax=Rhagoletis zephyria TaxID=28612 RepID=UPI0008112601|nr:PREDICTED: heterochromatin protein 1-like [Rhagoletis zephyria]
MVKSVSSSSKAHSNSGPSKVRAVELKRNSFLVEKILDKRINDRGVVEYYLKWRNFPSGQNSWEPVDNLSCVSLIKKFEKSLQEEHKDQIREHDYVPARVLKSLYNVKGMSEFYAGFQQKYPNLSIQQIDNVNDPVLPYIEAEKILGVNQNGPVMYFVVKFVHQDKPVFVIPEIMYDKWPEMASDFYNEWISTRYDSENKAV